MKQRLQHWVDRLDALGRRDRMALLGGALAALIGIEFTLVQPMATKRELMASALLADATAQTDALAAARTAQAQQLGVARQRMAELDTRLNGLGLRGKKRVALADFLAQVGRQGVALAGVRGLPVETLTLAAPQADEAAPTEQAASLLYRHRAELVLQGPVQGLSHAIGQLENNMAPLRIERVRVAPNAAGALQATLVLTTITEERTWFGL